MTAIRDSTEPQDTSVIAENSTGLWDRSLKEEESDQKLLQLNAVVRGGACVPKNLLPQRLAEDLVQLGAARYKCFLLT